jgi:hypothetical protein
MIISEFGGGIAGVAVFDQRSGCNNTAWHDCCFACSNRLTYNIVYFFVHNEFNIL